MAEPFRPKSLELAEVTTLDSPANLTLKELALTTVISSGLVETSRRMKRTPVAEPREASAPPGVRDARKVVDVGTAVT